MFVERVSRTQGEIFFAIIYIKKIFSNIREIAIASSNLFPPRPLHPKSLSSDTMQWQVVTFKNCASHSVSPTFFKNIIYIFFLKKFGNATDVELCLWRLYPDPLCVVAEALRHEGEAAVETSDGLGLGIFFCGHCPYFKKMSLT